MFCCCANCGERHDPDIFQDISKLLSRFFTVSIAMLFLYIIFNQIFPFKARPFNVLSNLKGVDLVPTDVAAGLLLVYESQRSTCQTTTATYQHIQSAPSLQNHGEPASTSYSGNLRNSDVTAAPPYWMTISNAAYFMKFACAIFGWQIHVYMNPGRGCCQLWKHCR